MTDEDLELIAALVECRWALQLITDPEAIKTTPVANAWAIAVMAETRARRLLESKGRRSNRDAPCPAE